MILFVVLISLLCQATAIDFSAATAMRLNSNEFSKTMRGMHVLPPPKFFKQQLINMCQVKSIEGFDFYLCHHLAKKQKYVVPILEHHEDEAAEEHVFLLELMPQKIYSYNDKTVAITSDEGTVDKELRVMVPKTNLPHHLKDRVKSILQEN